MKLSTSILAVGVFAMVLAGCNKKAKTTTDSRFKSMSLSQKENYLLNSNDTDSNKNNDFDPALYQQVMDGAG